MGNERLIIRRLHNVAFDRVEAISGRSSNMQRHIRTCDYITAEDRVRIMENFEASQAASRSSKELEDPRGNDDYPRLGHGHGRIDPGPTVWSPHAHNVVPHHHQYGSHQAASSLSGRSRATSQSDDDTTSSSSIPSPELGRRELARLVSSPPRPSPKLLIRDLLNEESEPPSYLYGKSSNAAAVAAAEKNKYARTSPGSCAILRHESSHLSELAMEHGLVAQLDHAIDEMQDVRARLEGRSGPQSGSQLPVLREENAATIAWLSRRMEELRRENETLKRRVSTTEYDNGELKAKLERIGEKFRLLESDSRRMPIGSVVGGSSGGGATNPFGVQHRATPRATSAPLVTSSESETLRKQRCGEGNAAPGFVPINK